MVINKKVLEIAEKIFIIFSLLHFSSTLNFFAGTTSAEDPTFQVGDVSDSNPILGLLQYLILGITLLLTAIRYRYIAYLASKRRFLWALAVLILLSFLWSALPDLTLRRGVIFLIIILFGLNVTARYSMREQLFLLSWTMGILVAINVLFTLALPSVGIEAGEHQGSWRGVYIQKNLFARMMVMSALTFLLATLESRSHRRILGIGLGLSVVLILLSGSKGALLIFLILVILLPLFKILRLSNNLSTPLMIIVLLLAASALIILVDSSETLAKFLGRDLTLTGRTGIWAVVIGKIAQHPWVGYGYKGFWRGMEGDSADVWYETFFLAPHAHNGFLDITVELGLIGLSLFLLTYGKSCLRAITWLKLNPSAIGLLPITYLMFMFLYNLTENSLTDPNYFIWALYSSITTSMLTQPILVSRTKIESNSEKLLSSKTHHSEI